MNSNSVFRISNVAHDGFGFTFYASTNNGASSPVGVYRSTNLVSGTWSLVTNFARHATGTNVWVDPSPPFASSVFYRPVVETNG